MKSDNNATISGEVMSSGLTPPFRMINALKAETGYVGGKSHAHPFYHLNYIISGNLTITFKGADYPVKAGQAFILPPDIIHSLYTVEGYTQIGIDIENKEDTRGFFNLIKTVANDECKISGILSIDTDFEMMKSIISNPTDFNILLAEHKAEEILLKTVTSLTKKSKSILADKFDEILKQNSTPSLKELCAITGYSRVHLERLSRAEFGCGAIEYINRLKSNRICSLLLNSNLSITEIAEKEGFYDPSHLTVFFKKRMNTTPSQFRKLHFKSV